MSKENWLTVNDLEVGTEILMPVQIGKYYPAFEEKVHFINTIQMYDGPNAFGFIGRIEIIRLGSVHGRWYFLKPNTLHKPATETPVSWHDGDPRFSR